MINLDLEKQLNKTKNYHINPLVKSKKTVKSNVEKLSEKVEKESVEKETKINNITHIITPIIINHFFIDIFSFNIKYEPIIVIIIELECIGCANET